MHWIDPAYLPELEGALERFLIDIHGDANGMLLTDHDEIHFPPHMSEAVVAAFKPGDPVKVRGVRPRGVDMIVAVSLQAGDAAPIVDVGPPHNLGKKPELEEHKHAKVEGLVTRLLHGPKGQVRGALLDNGTIVRIASQTATSLLAGFVIGHQLAARGRSVTNALGTIIDAHKIGSSLSSLHPIESKDSLEPPEHGSTKLTDSTEKFLYEM